MGVEVLEKGRALETFQLWSLPEPDMTTVEFVNFPAHEFYKDCCNQTQYICLENGNISPFSPMHGVTVTFSIVLFAPRFYSDFSRCKASTPGSGVTGQLTWSVPSPLPLLQGSSRNPAPPRPNFSSKTCSLQSQLPLMCAAEPKEQSFV